MNYKFNFLDEIKTFLDDDKEYMKSKPSYSFITSYSKKLLELVIEWKEINSEIHSSLYSIQRKIDILKADLPGELKHDFEKGNKRYRDKWLVQKQNLDSLKNSLIIIWKDNNN